MQENIKRIIAVRHGQSVGNIARHEAFLRDNNSFYEDPNFLDINPDHYELSQLGVEQSKKAGEFLRQVLLLNPGVYFSSNNFRTRQTAAYVFPDAILNINEPLLRERNYAGFDKLTKEDWQRRLKEANISDLEDSYDWKVPGGESAKDIEKRLDSFLSKLSEIKTDSDDTFIFTHGDLLQVLRVMLHKLDPSEYIKFKTMAKNGVKNCQIFIFNLDPKTNELISEETYFYENEQWHKGVYNRTSKIMEVSEYK